MKTALLFLALAIALWIIALCQPVYGQDTNITLGIDPTTDVCTNCPDPTPNPPIPFPTVQWVTITVSNVTLLQPWPTDYTVLFQSSDLVNWQTVSIQHYEPLEVFKLPVTAGQMFYTVSNEFLNL